MRTPVYLLGALLLVILLAGCTGGGGEKAPAPAETPQETPAETPAETQAPQATQAALHGEGTCDNCHDAPTLEDMRSGLHKQAFEKQPSIHKPLCSNCHNVEQTCTKCHKLPEVMKQ